MSRYLRSAKNKLRDASTKVLCSIYTINAFRKYDTQITAAQQHEEMLRDVFYSFNSAATGRLDIADLQDLLAVIHSEQNIKEEDVSATQRQHEQDVLSHLDELLPYYHHDGISFNQFVFLYNHLLNVTNHDTVTSTEKVRLKKKNSTVSHANQGLLSPVVYHEVLTEIERLLARQELSEDEAKLLYTIEDPTEIHPDEILDHEKQLVDCKLKLAGLVSLYSKTKSKMMLGNLKRELAWYKHAKQEFEEVHQQHKAAKENKNMLHGQLYKHTTSHTDMVEHKASNAAVSPKVKRSSNAYVHYDDFDHAKIDYFGLSTVASAFAEPTCDHLDKFTLEISPQIAEALVTHLQDMFHLKVLSLDLLNFAIDFVKQRDMYFIFACYKFVHHHESLVCYLQLRRGQSFEAKSADKKRTHQKMMKRANSYKMFIDERRQLHHALKEDIERKKLDVEMKEVLQKVVDQSSATTPTKKKDQPLPRWMLLYNDAKQKKRGEKYAGQKL